jgi:hypothetical protein
MNEHVDYKAKPANGATRFLWWCAGADAQILQYSSYSDYVKYVGIGGIVLGTGILASLSMFFAINYIFENVAIAIPVGLLWGAIIFNLDRFIVSSTGKGDGVDSISWKELGNATPRLLMAIILGFTISAPLEVYIFQKEIDKQFYKLDQEEQKAEIKKIEDIYTKSPEFNKLNQDKSTLEDEIKKLEQEREKYQGEAARETSQAEGGCGPNCQEFKRMAKEVESRIEERKKKISEIDKKLQVYDDNKNAKIKELSSVNNKAHGLLDRLLALHAIPGSTVPAWMIRLMFVFIEIAPVLLKLMLIKSPYDYMTDNVNQILEAKQGINREHIVDEYKKIHSMKGYANPKRIIEVVEHQNIHETENAKEAITRFADQEKQDIINDPSAFVKPDKPS